MRSRVNAIPLVPGSISADSAVGQREIPRRGRGPGNRIQTSDQGGTVRHARLPVGTEEPARVRAPHERAAADACIAHVRIQSSSSSAGMSNGRKRANPCPPAADSSRLAGDLRRVHPALADSGAVEDGVAGGLESSRIGTRTMRDRVFKKHGWLDARRCWRRIFSGRLLRCSASLGREVCGGDAGGLTLAGESPSPCPSLSGREVTELHRSFGSAREARPATACPRMRSEWLR